MDVDEAEQIRLSSSMQIIFLVGGKKFVKTVILTDKPNISKKVQWKWFPPVIGHFTSGGLTPHPEIILLFQNCLYFFMLEKTSCTLYFFREGVRPMRV